MRSWYAAMTAGITMMALAACVTPSIPIPPPKGPPPKPGERVSLPQALAQVNRVCQWAESTGNPAPTAQSDSMRHKHVSIVNWKLMPEKSWFQLFPRKGSVVKFNPEVSYSKDVDPASVYNDMELLDFRVVNAEREPAKVSYPLTAAQLCDEAAPPSVGGYFDGPLALSVAPLQNAEETNISEHVLVYTTLQATLQDGVHKWWVLLIWHVRSAEECALIKDEKDRVSCFALLELADLDPALYAQRAPELLSRVKYPYDPYKNTATKSHNGVIHGVLE